MPEMMPALASLAQPFAAVCHDAGAANIVIAEIQATTEVKCLPVMSGPAAKLWQDSGFDASALVTLDKALQTARSVLTGTGWASDIEHLARQRASVLGLYSAAVIDHWVNYPARFERQGMSVLPDEIWVTDQYAFEIASVLFKDQQIKKLRNLYLEDQLKHIGPICGAAVGRLLYLLEPLRFSWPGCTQLGEFVALDYFVTNVGKIAPLHSLQIRLRPHPSDEKGKYAAWLEKQADLDICIDTSRSLPEAIDSAQWVVGCETAAMVVALAAGRKVLSTLPPTAPRCRLPQDGILHLRDL